MGVRMRWVPLWLGDLRCAFKRKLPLVLYLLPLCWTIFASFQIYLTYAAKQNTAVMDTGGLDAMVLMMKLANVDIEVNRFISGFYTFSRLWAVLAAIWYGAGLLSRWRNAAVSRRVAVLINSIATDNAGWTKLKTVALMLAFSIHQNVLLVRPICQAVLKFVRRSGNSPGLR